MYVGVIGFGIGNVVGDGLKLGAFFDPSKKCKDRPVMEALTPAVHTVFTVVQILYILKIASTSIRKHVALAKIGVLHLVACNLCTWLRTLAMETKEEISRYITNTSEGITWSFSANSNNNSHNKCWYAAGGLLGETIKNLSPFIYPCTVEYSLIAAGILYLHWTNIGDRDNTQDENIPASTTSRNVRLMVNCRNSATGLVTGFTLITATFVVIIIDSTFAGNIDLVTKASTVFQSMALILYIPSILATIFCMVDIRRLECGNRSKHTLNRILLFIALGGFYLFGAFTFLAGVMTLHIDYSVNASLTVFMFFVQFVQGTLQVIFLLDGFRRWSTPAVTGSDYTRQCLVFLILANLSLWALSIFEVQRKVVDSVSHTFYSFIPWVVISHICCPLVILFRYNSAACLYEIWNDCFRL